MSVPLPTAIAVAVGVFIATAAEAALPQLPLLLPLLPQPPLLPPPSYRRLAAAAKIRNARQFQMVLVRKKSGIADKNKKELGQVPTMSSFLVSPCS